MPTEDKKYLDMEGATTLYNDLRTRINEGGGGGSATEEPPMFVTTPEMGSNWQYAYAMHMQKYPECKEYGFLDDTAGIVTNAYQFFADNLKPAENITIKNVKLGKIKLKESKNSYGSINTSSPFSYYDGKDYCFGKNLINYNFFYNNQDNKFSEQNHFQKGEVLKFKNCEFNFDRTLSDGSIYYGTPPMSYMFDACPFKTVVFEDCVFNDPMGLKNGTYLGGPVSYKTPLNLICKRCTFIGNLNDFLSGTFGYEHRGYLIDCDTSRVTDMTNLFRGYRFNDPLQLGNLDTSNVKNFGYMFAEYKAYAVDGVALDVSMLNTSKATSMYDMFQDTEIHNLDLSNFDTSNVVSMQGMFSAYDSSHYQYLTNITFGNNWGPKVTNTTNMFHYANNLTRETVVDLFNKLAPRTDNPTLTFERVVYNRLTSADRAIATGKGWSVASY